MTEASEQLPTVRLRRYAPADADWYVTASRDPQIQRFTSEPDDLNAAVVQDAIAASAADPQREAYLICGRADEDRLGNLAIRISGATAELSYWVAAEARGHGVAARAIGLAVDLLAATGSVRRVTLWTVADNIASRRSAERAGFRMTGAGRRRLGGRPVDAAEYELVLATERRR